MIYQQQIAYQIASITRYVDERLLHLMNAPLEFRIAVHEITTLARDLLGNGFGPEGVIAQAMINLGYAFPRNTVNDGYEIHIHYEAYELIVNLQGQMCMMRDRHIALRNDETKLQSRIKSFNTIINCVAPTLS